METEYCCIVTSVIEGCHGEAFGNNNILQMTTFLFKLYLAVTIPIYRIDLDT